MFRLPKIVLSLLAFLLVLPLAAHGQGMPPEGAPPAASYAPQQIDQLVAPIALYPDPLVAQILMAATYPLEVVEASRWLQNPQNAQLRGDQLAAAMAQQPWDPSVKALVNAPQVLAILDGNLQWTEQLGDAFLAQQAEVMDSVQRLRQMAQASGNLASTPQQTVTVDSGVIDIAPTNPTVMYVPYYNPTVVYGTWPYPAYEPYYFPPPYGLYYAATGIISFGVGLAVVDTLWGWDRWDWRHHRIDIDDRRFAEINRGRPPLVAGEWSHDPAHRHGVPYASPASRTKFQGAPDQARRDFRGYAPQAAARPSMEASPRPVVRQATDVQHASVATPAREMSVPQRQAAPVREMAAPQRQAAPVRQMAAPQRQAAPAFESFSRGPDVRTQSQRGSYSRSTAPAPAARSAHPVRSGEGHNNIVGH